MNLKRKGRSGYTNYISYNTCSIPCGKLHHCCRNYTYIQSNILRIYIRVVDARQVEERSYWACA